MWARKGIDRKREKERERKGEQNKRVNIQTSSRPSRYVCLHCESQSTFLREACCRCDCYEQECERDAIHIQTHQFRAQNKKPLSAGFTLEWRILCSDLHVQVAGSETGVLSQFGQERIIPASVYTLIPWGLNDSRSKPLPMRSSTGLFRSDSISRR